MTDTIEGLELFDFADDNAKLPFDACNFGSEPNTVASMPPKQITEKNANIIRCELCDVTINSSIVYNQHVYGQKHIKKLNQLKININSPVQHVKLKSNDNDNNDKKLELKIKSETEKT